MVSSDTSFHIVSQSQGNQSSINWHIYPLNYLLTKEFPLIPPYIQHPVPDECTLMGVITEKTLPSVGMEKN